MTSVMDHPVPSPLASSEPCEQCAALLTRRKFLGLTVTATASLLLADWQRPAAAADPVPWSYDGESGPAKWGQLSPDFATCAMGKNQSPVDIPASAPVIPAGITFAYQPTNLNIFNNGHTIQVNYDPGSSMQVDGNGYSLVQFHFHTRSEHTLANKPSDMELHLVHRDAGGNLAVVGVLLNKGKDNPAFAPIWLHLPTQAGSPQTVSGVTLHADTLLPADRSFYRYEGSLTTPPCTEGVKWHVMRTPVELSDAQVTAFQKIFPNNARPVQPLNNRVFGFSASAPTTMPVTGADLLRHQGLLLGAGALLVAAGLRFRRSSAV